MADALRSQECPSVKTPADAARITYEILEARSNPLKALSVPTVWQQPIPTPIKFWEISYTMQDEGETDPERCTAGTRDLCMTIYQRYAGYIGSSRFLPCDADKAAEAEFRRHQDHFINGRYKMSSIEVGIHVMRWTGISKDLNARGKRIIVNLQAKRGPVDPTDPAVSELSNLLRAKPLKLWY